MPDFREPTSEVEQHPEDARTRVALLFYTDLMFGVQLQNMARASGFKPYTVRSGGTLPDADVMIVDLAARSDWEPAIRESIQRGILVVAFGPHLDADARRRAKEAGAARVLANSNLARDLPGILDTVRKDERRMTNDGSRMTNCD